MVDSTTQTPKRSRSRAGAPTESASLDDLVAGLDSDGAADAPTPKRRGRKAAADAPAPPEASADAVVEAEPALVPTPATPTQVEVPNVLLSAELPLAEDDDLSAIEGEAAPRLVSIVESLLFAASKPLGVRDIRLILKEASLRQVQLALKQLGRDLESRGIVLAQTAGGFRLRTNPENGRWVQQLLAERPVKLSRSQLESLAVIAYRQPITKPECDHIRGVDCAAVLKVLLDYDLVRIVGRKEEPGRPHLYGTTLKFLEFFNLRSLRDMPDLHEFRELTEESRAVMREQLGEAGLYDEREAMGQEVLDWNASTPTDDPASTESAEGEVAASTEDEVAASTEDEVAEDAADEVTEDAADEVTEAAADEVTEDTADDVTEDAADEVTEDAADEVTEDAADEVTEDAADEVTEDAADEVTEDAADEVTEDAADEVTEDAADEVTEDAADEVTEDAADEVTEDAADEVTEDAADEVADENDEVADEAVDDPVAAADDETTADADVTADEAPAADDDDADDREPR